MIKLLKNDFISTGRIMGVIYAVMVGVSLFIVLSKNVAEGQISAITGVLLVVASACMLIVTTVVILLDFQRTLYGDQGYLTFTLPVKSWKILASKLIVSIVWLVISFASIFYSSYITVAATKKQFGDEYDLFSEMIEELVGKDVDSMIANVFAYIILFFVSMGFFTMVVFFANTVSNTKFLQKHSIFSTVAITAVFMYAVIKLCDFINRKLVFCLFFIEGKPKFAYDVQTYYMYSNFGSGSNPACNVSEIIVYVVLGIALFFATHTIMKKFVNIR